MSLLERQTESTILNAALDRASAGSGAVILVSGEAGIGKTALNRALHKRRKSAIDCPAAAVGCLRCPVHTATLWPVS